MSLAARTSCGLLLGLLIPACAPTRGEPKAATGTTVTPVVRENSTPVEPTIEPVAPPLVLGDPPMESMDLNGENISNALPSELIRLAREYAANGNFPLASRYQYWYVHQTGEGRYDLARYYAGAGASDAAVYWLHAAAREEGVDPEAIGHEPLFDTLVTDARWPSLRSFLQSSVRSWETQGQPVTTLVLPQGYTPERGPLWVVAWFHDSGSHPRSLVEPDDEDAECRFLADSLNIAFVGISGTTPRGKKTYAWSEDPARDFVRVQAALAEVSARVAIRPAGIIAVGAGQGARTALELAARHPEMFGGAIAMSPGKLRSRLNELTAPHPLLAQRGFVIGSQESETEDERARTVADAAWFEAVKARVTPQTFSVPSPGMLPLHFTRLFPNWVRIVQSAQAGS